MEVNWPVVVIRIIDGALYGTGFIFAVLCWVWFVEWMKKKSKSPYDAGQDHKPYEKEKV